MTTVLHDLCPYFKTSVVVYAERAAIFNTSVSAMSAAWSVKGSFARDVTVSYGQYVCISRITEPNSSPAWLQGRVQFTVFKTVIWGQKLQRLQRARRAASRSTNRTLLQLHDRNSEGKMEGRGRCCEHQEFVLQPWASPSSLHLLGCVHRRIWISLQGIFEHRNLVSFRGNFKCSTPNVLPLGRCSPKPQTGCPVITPVPAYLLCNYPWNALVSPEVPASSLFLLQPLFQLPALLPSTVPSASWSGHAT